MLLRDCVCDLCVVVLILIGFWGFLPSILLALGFDLVSLVLGSSCFWVVDDFVSVHVCGWFGFGGLGLVFVFVYWFVLWDTMCFELIVFRFWCGLILYFGSFVVLFLLHLDLVWVFHFVLYFGLVLLVFCLFLCLYFVLLILVAAWFCDFGFFIFGFRFGSLCFGLCDLAGFVFCDFVLCFVLCFVGGVLDLRVGLCWFRFCGLCFGLVCTLWLSCLVLRVDWCLRVLRFCVLGLRFSLDCGTFGCGYGSLFVLDLVFAPLCSVLVVLMFVVCMRFLVAWLLVTCCEFACLIVFLD